MLLYLCSDAGSTCCRLSPAARRVPAQTHGYRASVSLRGRSQTASLGPCLSSPPFTHSLHVATRRSPSSVVGHRSAARSFRVVGCRWSVVVGTSLQYNSVLGSSIVHINCQCSGRRRSPGGSVRLSVRLSTNYNLWPGDLDENRISKSNLS